MALDDVLIFRKINNGSIQAFETLFRRYYESLCRYSQSLTGELESSEEIVQDLFYKIWKERENIHILSVKSYLYGAIHNNSLQYLKHKQIEKNYQELMLEKQNDTISLTPEEQLEYKELEEQLDKALDQLPQRRKAIFKMSRFEGKKYIEIANELSLSVKTVEAEMSKALQTLREKMIKNKNEDEYNRCR